MPGWSLRVAWEAGMAERGAGMDGVPLVRSSDLVPFRGGAGTEGQEGAGGCCGRPGKAASAGGVEVRGWVLPGGAGAATCLRLAPKSLQREG